MKTCPVGTGVLDKLECTKACTQLGLPFVEKKFRAGRKCYKNGKGMCNQNGAAGSKATMLCKVVGKWIKHILCNRILLKHWWLSNTYLYVHNMYIHRRI